MSVLRGFSQIPSRVSRFVILNDLNNDVTVGWTSSDVAAGLDIARGDGYNFDYDGTTVNAKSLIDIKAIYGFISVSILSNTVNEGAEFRDLGKQLRFTYNGQLVAAWTKVQIIRGQQSEGASVSNSTSVFYVATFNSDDRAFDNALVARLG